MRHQRLPTGAEYFVIVYTCTAPLGSAPNGQRQSVRNSDGHYYVPSAATIVPSFFVVPAILPSGQVPVRLIAPSSLIKSRSLPAGVSVPENEDLPSMIILKNVTLRRGSKVLLDKTSVTLNPAEKVGLVGRNGAGKSSLFALLNGTLHEDGGEFSIPSQWRMSQVAQDMPETEQSATDFVVEGDTILLAAQTEVTASEASDDGMRMAHAYMALHDAGAHDAASRAQALILGLGFSVAELDRPVNSFSGGWRMRLQLARALMCPSDLLLLDEPTNHLDLDALVWLEAWLKNYAGTMVVISHDREFLDAVTNVTLHIDNGTLVRYGGNYSKFEDMRAEQMSLQQAAHAKQQEKVAHLQKFIDRFKAKASKAKQAQSRVKALERMEKIAPMLADAEFQFEFKQPLSMPNPMLSMTDASFGYPPSEDAPADAMPTVIVNNINRSVLAGQRIGILGANGQGKSTLVKTIAGALTPIAGEIIPGKGLNIGYFSQQELDVLRPADSPLEHMIRPPACDPVPWTVGNRGCAISWAHLISVVIWSSSLWAA